MSLKTLIVLLVVAFFIFLLIAFPEFRALCFGWTRVFIKDMATTPEGAAAIYEEKINEARNKYNKADDALRYAAGKLATEKKKLENSQNRLKEVESSCEALVKAGKLELAQVKSDERAEILSDIERSKKLIEAYTKARDDAQEVHRACDATLRKLKRESKEVVENMKVKAQLNEVYDSMDDLKNVTGTDKLLDSIKEKNESLNATVEGARVIHDSRTSTKVQRANEQAKKLQSDDYLESLKKKYNK